MKRGFEVWLNLSTSTFWRVVRCVMWDLSMTGVSAQHPVWRRYPAAAAGQCWPRWRWVKRHCEHQHGGRGGWQHCFHCALKERQQTAGDWTWLTTILVSHWFAYSFFVEPHLCFDSDSQFAVKSSLQLWAQFAFVVRCKMICHCVSVWTSTDGDGCVSVCLSVRIVVSVWTSTDTNGRVSVCLSVDSLLQWTSQSVKRSPPSSYSRSRFLCLSVVMYWTHDVDLLSTMCLLSLIIVHVDPI